MILGPNHKPGCDGARWRYSGDGYNRVRVCACGAEDHAPCIVAIPEASGEVRGVLFQVTADGGAYDVWCEGEYIGSEGTLREALRIAVEVAEERGRGEP